ncbi:beta-carotene 15,15'-monooxygenase [Streptococcus loxodontisalivarius]|uniref:Multisubunit Na+/H+ antiporter MnhG subunit n=1 Tax=Streptococcus loxodontisalivarius TaxID=1349415 RepID=A0ABS2PSG8_9STRE|nr:beta-carotene 15,15'-monooxygenase [Streptococcus loxodontisalivarius]MBM7642988.1 multisubunit Na+/H+ antiporter MnhG subunit [Streptococcus loxodontisalivarius]
MIIIGYLVITHTTADNQVLNWTLSILSALIAAVDVWIIVSLSRFLVNSSAILQNRWLTTTVGVTFSAIYNLFYVAISFLSGAILRSSWYMLYAVYHLIFGIIKHYLGHDLRRQNDSEKNWQHYRHVGYFMIPAAAIFHIMVIAVASNNDKLESKYPMLIYIVALTTFISVITSAVNLFRFRQDTTPIMKASKNLNFAASLFSLFFLQTMMMKQFGGSDDPSYHRLMTILLGTIIFLILISLGTYMIFKAHHEEKRLKEQV